MKLRELLKLMPTNDKVSLWESDAFGNGNCICETNVNLCPWEYTEREVTVLVNGEEPLIFLERDVSQ